MGDFMDKAQDFAEKHDKQVDQGIDKAGDQVDKRTGGKYGKQVEKGEEMAQQRTGQGDQGR
ncbi:MAG TPA: antitoxin [Micromonospora sp.]